MHPYAQINAFVYGTLRYFAKIVDLDVFDKAFHRTVKYYLIESSLALMCVCCIYTIFVDDKSFMSRLHPFGVLLVYIEVLFVLHIFICLIEQKIKLLGIF